MHRLRKAVAIIFARPLQLLRAEPLSGNRW